MTCGIYGLADPDTGLVRWVSASRDIEFAYRQHCALAWKRSPGAKVTPWLITLHRAGKAPVLKILQRGGEDKFNRIKREYIKIYELIGGADLNVNLTTKL